LVQNAVLTPNAQQTHTTPRASAKLFGRNRAEFNDTARLISTRLEWRLHILGVEHLCRMGKIKVLARFRSWCWPL
jgi:hypothetical protein